MSDPEKALREAHDWHKDCCCGDSEPDTACPETAKAINRLARAAFEAGKHHAYEETNTNQDIPAPSWLPKEEK